MTVYELDKIMEKVFRKRYPDMKGVYHPSPGRWIVDMEYRHTGIHSANINECDRRNTFTVRFVPENHDVPAKTDETDDLAKSLREFHKSPEYLEHRKQVEREIREMKELGWSPEAISDDL